MRIVGGKLRGKRLSEVGAGDKAAQLRPTSDRVRENLFNVLTNGALGNLVAEARVLDICAGTGALGLEALSRGAAHVLFIDNGRAALRLIEQNIALCNGGDLTRILATDALGLRVSDDDPYDLVFLDPPYGKDYAATVLGHLLVGKWLADNATVVVEENREIPTIQGFERMDHRRYGDTHLHLFRPLD